MANDKKLLLSHWLKVEISAKVAAATTQTITTTATTKAAQSGVTSAARTTKEV